MNNKKTCKWILSHSKKYLPHIILNCLFCIGASSIYVLLAHFSKKVIDTATPDGNSVLIGAFILFGLILLQIALNASVSLVNAFVNGKLTIVLRNRLFTSVVRKKYPLVFEHHTGDLLNRFTSDIDQVVGGAATILPSLCSMLAKIIAGILALILENYIFAFIVLAVGFIFPLIGRIISKKYKYLHKAVQETEGQSRSFLQESFANIVVIKTFDSESPILNKLNAYLSENFKTKMKRSGIQVTMNTCLNSFFTIGYYAVLVWGAYSITSGKISTGTLFYYLQLVSMLRAPLQNVSGILPRYFAMVASAERLIELENMDVETPPLKYDKIDNIKSDFKFIYADKLSFAYNDTLIIRNSSFKIHKNSITAITGGSGSGKSTFFKLLLGLYDVCGGSLTFNGTTDINSATRPMFSYVPQVNMILSGTILENLTLCNPDVDMKKVEQACRAAMIYDFISSLPDGFNTKISERGAGLSEGQIQRISIARALLFDAPILLLDESTSALDEPTETALLSNIKNMTDKTVIFITHRNTSISVCDHIINIKNKEFTEQKKSD
ncbi:MAG: ABC transporter ATP-binding protein [Acutalibacteraceae bacterium]|nr:ABC transporter ATP-binding protein [Acutalibacteraceae bacterium]